MLSAGTRVGPYEILGPLGSGGMGEVYRARDTKLNRDVALKILPELFASDPDRLARFRREAQILASLNHPNIATIHGIEEAVISGATVHALVMELVDGETLADRIRRGPIPIDETLPFARQVAEALEAAHEAGIIHRDAKPANIKVRPDGSVKVLDFGLAKVLDGGMDSSPSLSLSPTLTSPAYGTHVGVVMGTAAYMSPEQARGRTVDRRSDIWAFGCVLYEMLTARRPFDDEDVSLTLSKVLQRDPDWGALSGEVPRPVSVLLRRCLEKDPRRRVRDIGEAWSAVEAALAEPAEQTTATAADRTASTAKGSRLSSWAFAGVPAIVAAALAGAVVWQLRSVAEPAVVKRFVVPLPDGERFTGAGRRFLAVSPDASHIAYTANRQLYVRAIDELAPVPVAGTAEARSPFFSPDGKWIGFWQDGQLKKVAISGGAPLVLCAAENPYGVSWERDGFVLFSQGPEGISRVPEGGGTPSRVISLDKTKGEVAYGPQLLPDGKTILFALLSGNERAPGTAAWDNAEVVVQDTRSSERQVVVKGGTAAQYLPTGHIVYVLEHTLLAAPFDAARHVLTGNPVSLIQSVAAAAGEEGGVSATNGVGGTTGAGQFAVSATGLLVYAEAGESPTVRTLVWVDRQGKESPVPGLTEERAFVYPRISPDGKRVALDIRDREQDIWVFDFDPPVSMQLTRGPVPDIGPVWTDGQRIAYFRRGEGLFRQAANGTGSVEALTKTTTDVHAADAMTPDGTHLIFDEDRSSASRAIKSLNLDDRTITTVIADSQVNQNAAMSPDGRWIAYQSGPANPGAPQREIYVRPFPNVDGGKWQISTGGGATRPVWSRNGRELFYLAQKAAGAGPPSATLMAVPVETGPTFKRGNPIPLFSGSYYTGLTGVTYDVDPTGQRFLMIKNPPEAVTRPVRLLVVENWFEELKARAK